MRRLSYGLFGVSALMIAGALVLLALSFAAPSVGFGYRGWSIVFAATFVVVGLLISSRRPENAIGWVLAVLGLGASLLALADEVGYFATTHDDAVGAWGGWIGEWLWVPLIGGVFVLLPLIFPNGRLLSRRWRAVVVLLAVATTTGSFWLAFVPGPLDQSPRFENPLGLALAARPLVKSIGDIGLSVLMACIAVAALSLVLRFRRSRGVERQQIKWLAFSVGVASATFAVYLPFGVRGTSPPKFVEVVMTSAILAVPVCIGIAVMRYRLYEIDRIVSRTVSYAIIWSLLGGTFAVVALVPTAVVGTANSPDWVIAMATLVVAALFRPVRRRVQDAVDHRFNRRRYDAQHTVDAFSQRLREQIDIDALGAELCAVVNTTMQPSRVSLWLAGRP